MPRFLGVEDCLARTDRSTDCWIWTGSVDANGYGRLSRHPRRVERYLHRLVFAQANGPIPPGLFVCHHCDTPPCIRLAHLFLGTTQDNMADMVAKGRSLSGDLNPMRLMEPEARPRGSRNGWAKLDEAQVAEIKKRLAQGERWNDLGNDYGVVAGAIWMIAKGRNWAHVGAA
jgi:hypothetical protein